MTRVAERRFARPASDDRIGLGGPGAGGVVAALIGSTAVVAVLVTLRVPADERRARAAAPFLALTPLVIWMVVSTDAVILAVTAWGIALLALASTAAEVAAFAVGPAVLAGGAVLAVLAATVSGLSKSEVERIWLPFLLWLVPLTALVPAGHQRRWPAASAAWGLAVGVLFRTTW